MVAEMSDDLNSADAAAVDEPVARYCRFCGAPWPPGAAWCPACDPRTQISPPEPGFAVTSDAAAGSWIGHGVSEAILLYSLLLAVSIVSALLPLDDDSTFSRIVVAYLLMVPIVLMMAVWAGEVVTNAIRFRLRPVAIPLIAAAVCCTLGAAEINTRLIFRFLSARPSNLVDAFGMANQSAFIQVLVVAVLPAILEEVSFRGIILPFLANRVTVVAALVISSAAFAALHLNMAVFPFLLCMGLVLGWLRLVTGSLIPPIVVHFVHNAIVWALATTA